MNLHRIALGSVLVAGTLGRQSLSVSPTLALPDLKITQVIESGSQAYVRVVNGGMVASGACNLRVYHSFGAGWFVTATTGVPGLAPGAGAWINVVNFGIAAPFNRYRVDIFNAVPEQDETNNGYSTP